MGENEAENKIWLIMMQCLTRSFYVCAYWFTEGALIQKTAVDAHLPWGLYAEKHLANFKFWYSMIKNTKQ